MNGSDVTQSVAAGKLTEYGKVLVVDDDPAVCHVTGQMLELHGFQVLYAENGEQALALFDEYDDHGIDSGGGYCDAEDVRTAIGPSITHPADGVAGLICVGPGIVREFLGSDGRMDAEEALFSLHSGVESPRCVSGVRTEVRSLLLTASTGQCAIQPAGL